MAHEVAPCGTQACAEVHTAGPNSLTVSERSPPLPMEGEKGKEFENMIGSLQDTLFDKGLDQGMEFEADVGALETAYRTGYDPNGLIDVLKELKKNPVPFHAERLLVFPPIRPFQSESGNVKANFATTLMPRAWLTYRTGS